MPEDIYFVKIISNYFCYTCLVFSAQGYLRQNTYMSFVHKYVRPTFIPYYQNSVLISSFWPYLSLYLFMTIKLNTGFYNFTDIHKKR